MVATAAALFGCAHRAPLSDTSYYPERHAAPQKTQSLKDILHALKDRRAEARREAAYALDDYVKEHPEDTEVIRALPALVEIMEDSNLAVTAARAIGTVAEKHPGHPGFADAIPALSVLIDWGGTPRDEAFRALVNIGYLGPVPALIKGVKMSSGRQLTDGGLFKAVDDKNADAVPVLTEVLKLKEARFWGLRTCAAYRIGDIAEKTGDARLAVAVLPLIELAENSGSLNEARAAVRALGQIGDIRAAPMLVEMLEKFGTRTCAPTFEAIKALGRLGEKNRGNPEIAEAVPVLIRLTKDKEWWNRNTVARALGMIGDERALPALQEMDGPEAEEAIRKISKQ